MAVQQPVVCVCGGPGVPEGGKKRVLFPCAGASNTGQISNSAAVQLTLEGYGILACTAGVPVRAPSTMKRTSRRWSAQPGRSRGRSSGDTRRWQGRMR